MIYILLFINLLVVYSYFFNNTIPFVIKFFNNERLRVKLLLSPASIQSKNLSRLKIDWLINYQKLLNLFIIILSGKEDSLDAIYRDDNILGIIKSKSRKITNQRKQEIIDSYLAEYLTILKKKQKKLAYSSVAGSSLAILVSFLIVYFFPIIFSAQAATFSWIQNSWSGGATTTYATHSQNKLNWNYYESVSSGLVISSDGSEISLSTSSEYFEDGVSLVNSTSGAATGGGFANGTFDSSQSIGGAIRLAASTTDPGDSSEENAATDLIYDSSSDLIWGINRTSNQLIKFDPLTMAVSATYTVSTTPVALAFDPDQNKIWIIHSNGRLLRFNPLSGQVDYSTSTGGGADDGSIAYDSTNHYVWVSVQTLNKLHAYDAITGNKIYATNTGVLPVAVAYDGTNNLVWVVNKTSSTIQAFNASDGTQNGSDIAAGVTNYLPSDLVYDDIQNSIWVSTYVASGYKATKIQQFSAETRAQVGTTISVAASASLGARHSPIFYEHDTNSIWVNIPAGSHLLYKYNASNQALVNIRYSNSGGNMAYDSRRGALWISSVASSGKIQKLKASTALPFSNVSSTNQLVTNANIIGDIVTSYYYGLTSNGNNFFLAGNFFYGKFNAVTMNRDTYATAVGNYPRLSYDADSNIIWAIKPSANEMVGLNPDTGTVARTAKAVSSTAQDIEYDSTNKWVWIVSSANNILQKFSATSSPIVQVGTNISTQALPYRVKYYSGDNSVFVINKTSSTLQKFDAATGNNLYTVSTGIGPQDMVIDSFHQSVWVINYTSSTLQRFRISDGYKELEVAVSGAPISLVYDPNQNAIWVANWQGYIYGGFQKVQKYNADTGVKTGLAYAAGSLTCGLAFSEKENHLFFPASSKDVVLFDAGYFLTSGIYTSASIDAGSAVDYSTISWTPTSNSSSTGAAPVKFQVAANNNNATWNFIGPDGTSATYFTTASGEALPSSLDGNRYFKYKVYLSTSDPSVTPAVNSVRINYVRYVAEATLTSSAFNSEDLSNIIGDILWSQTVPDGTQVKFQIRTAPAANTSTPGTWSDWLGPTGTSSFYVLNGGNNPINSLHNDRSGDQWFQYKAILTSNGQSSPILSSITLKYVVNIAPEIRNVSSSQRLGDGLVEISYEVRDSDTTVAGASCSGCVIPSFDYSIDGGVTWNPITNGLSEDATSSKAVEGIEFTTYNLTWNAKNQINGIYDADFKVKVSVNDLEGASNTASADSPAFVLDVKNPTSGGTAARVIATTTPAQLTFDATDDSSFEVCYSLNNVVENCVPYSTTGTISLLSDPDTVYVSFKDAFNNIYSVLATTPETPKNIVIRDVSNVPASEYQEFIVWKAVSLPFARYEIWYSTTGASNSYSHLANIEDRNTNYYFHKNLDSSLNYYYKVYVVDDSGNASSFSSIVYDQPDGLGGTVNTPPNITSVSVTATTTQSATIVWSTDQLSDSEVFYSAVSTTYDQVYKSVSYADNESGIGKHQIVLTGLFPDTVYYFKVKSSNINTVYDEDDNGGEGFTFRTKAGPVISAVTANRISNSSANIVWNTSESANSRVIYSSSSSMTGSREVGILDSNTLGHSVSVTGLSPGTNYYYYIESGIAIDNNGGQYYNFKTSNDEVAPVITGLTEEVVIDTKALIAWVTNELASSVVEYGIATSTYCASTSNNNLNTSHAINLTGLATSTTYHYRVVSTDASGNTSYSEDGTFITMQKLSQEDEVIAREDIARLSSSSTCPVCQTCGGGGGGGSTIDRSKPVISGIKVSDIAGEGVTINWTSDKKGIYNYVEYGSSSNFDFSFGKMDNSTAHSVSLKKLDQDTKYNFRVNTIDENGNLGSSDTQTFTTANTLLAEDSSPTDKESVYLAALNKAMSIVSEMSSQVSINFLESALNSQYNTIRQFSNIMPAPFLSGEPRVLVTSNTATITWKTDKESNSLVAIARDDFYDKAKGSEGYSQVIGNPTEAVTLHTVFISDLEPDSLYHYQVRSMSGIGALGQSADFTFRTRPKELEISSYTIEKISAQSAIFKWLTNSDTDASVKYTPYRNGVLAVEEAKLVRVKTLATLHEVTVDDFESGVLYEIELSGKDLKGKIISKKISSFSTGDDNFPPVIYQVQTESALSAGKESNVQTIISWLTNEPATGQVFYQKGVGSIDDASWEKVPLDPNYSKKHIVVITKFEPGEIYQFKIQGSDSNNNIANSKVYTILAPKQKESVFQVIMKNFEEVFGWTQKINR